MTNHLPKGSEQMSASTEKVTMEQAARELLAQRIGTTREGRGWLPDRESTRKLLDRLEAALAEELDPFTHCVDCGKPNGSTPDCDLCGLFREEAAAERAILPGGCRIPPRDVDAVAMNVVGAHRKLIAYVTPPTKFDLEHYESLQSGWHAATRELNEAFGYASYGVTPPKPGKEWPDA